MRKAFLFMSLFGWLFSCKSQEKSAKQDGLSNFIQRRGDSLQKANKLPGLFVGVFDGERKFFNFGYADPAAKTPFDASIVFEAGSITKTFTAYILETVLRSKGISDTSSIFSYLPDSVQTNKSLAPITFLSLLNHTSGLPRLPDNLDLTSTAPYDGYTVNDLFSYLKRATLKPDGKSNYSNLGAGLAGVLAERIAGKDYKTLLQEYVFQPFGMKDAMSSSNSKKAQGHLEGAPNPFWNMNVLYPAGGAQCSANDMLNYLQAMSSGKSEVLQKVLQHTVSVSPTVSVCSAWHTLEQKGKPTIYWHNGGTYGFSTFAGFVKETGRCVIVVVNQFNQNGVSDGFGMAIMKKMLE